MFFSLSLPWLFLVRTREKSRRLKQNKQEQGKMVFVYFGAEWAAVRCSLFCYSCGSLCETKISPLPVGPSACCHRSGKGSALCRACLPQKQTQTATVGSDWEWWLLFSWPSTPKSTSLSTALALARFPAARAVSQPVACLVLEVLYLTLPRSLEEPMLQADRKGAGAVLAPSARTWELELFVFPGDREDTSSHLLQGV